MSAFFPAAAGARLLKKPVNESREKEKYTKDLFARFSLASVAGKPLISSEHRTAKGGATASLGAEPDAVQRVPRGGTAVFLGGSMRFRSGTAFTSSPRREPSS